MRGSAHDRYRDRLAALVDERAFGDVLGGPPDGWERHFARFHPGRAPWATLVHVGPGERPLVLTTEVYEDDADAPPGVVATAAGPVLVRRFPDDPRLPGLAAVVSAAGRWRLARYRPGRRCTLHVETASGGRWVKVLGDGAGRRIVAESRHLWRESVGGTLGFAVAEPDRFDAATGSVWHHEVPGRPIEHLVLGPAAGPLVERLGAALGRLGRAPLAPAELGGRADQVARTGRAVERAARAVPALAAGLRARADRLAAAAGRLPPERSVPVHGAPHVHQWLLDGDRLGLVDFDRFAAGEPELDLATFLAELRSERRLVVDLDDLQAALVAGYESTGLPVDGDVLAWYRAHKLLAKVARSTQAVRPDGDERAARHLAAVDAVMGELGACLA